VIRMRAYRARGRLRKMLTALETRPE
jgi:hypothetical protein